MGATVLLKDGPIGKQSIGQMYKDKSLPETVAKLSSKSITCPVTGRGLTQRDNHQIFLIPAKN
jgi:hypothetical protein